MNEKLYKFLDYWECNISKKLFRCSKEFGFYGQLKELMGPKDSFKRIEFLATKIVTVAVKISTNPLSVITCGTDRVYEVYTAAFSKNHLSHLLATEILKDLRIATPTFYMADEWLYDEILGKNRFEKKFYEFKAYIKLFFLNGNTVRLFDLHI